MMRYHLDAEGVIALSQGCHLGASEQVDFIQSFDDAVPTEHTEGHQAERSSPFASQQKGFLAYGILRSPGLEVANLNLCRERNG